MALIPGLQPLILTNTMIQGYHHDDEEMAVVPVCFAQVHVFGKGVRQCVLSRILFDLRSFVVSVDNDGNPPLNA